MNPSPGDPHRRGLFSIRPFCRPLNRSPIRQPPIGEPYRYLPIKPQLSLTTDEFRITFVALPELVAFLQRTYSG